MRRRLLLLLPLLAALYAAPALAGVEVKPPMGVVPGPLTMVKTLGPDIVVDGGFSDTANWTEGAGWSLATGAGVHTGGTAGTLTPTVALVPTVGTTYSITATGTFPDTRSLSIAFGGTTCISAWATTRTQTCEATAGTTGNLTISPTTAGTTLTIDNVSIQPRTDIISNTAGPILLYGLLADPSANQAAVTIIGKQTGAGGTKTALEVRYEGAVGAGSEYIQSWYALGSIAATMEPGTNGTLLSLFGAFPQVKTLSSAVLGLYGMYSASAGASVQTGPVGTRTNTTGQNYGHRVVSTYNQASGDGANTDLEVYRTETALGSGKQRIIAASTSVTPGLWNVTNKGHVNTIGAAAPSLSDCGNSPTIATGSSDHGGRFTIGATGTGCVVTFATAFANAPACPISGANDATSSTSTTAITVTAAPGEYSYACIGINE